MNKNITPVNHKITATDRMQHYGHAGAVLWLTGLSGSGKSTLAMALERELTDLGYSCYVLDGDNVRGGINSDLGFSAEGRTENIRRVGELAALFADAGLICITAFISPYRKDRERARGACGHAFHEIHVATGLSICEVRDPKGLYRQARAGKIDNFTGIDAPYEIPIAAELAVDTSCQTVGQSVMHLVHYVQNVLPLARRAGGPRHLDSRHNESKSAKCR